MQTNEILTVIDDQIFTLQQLRFLLTNRAKQKQTSQEHGRPNDSVSKAANTSAPTAVKNSKRMLSEAGRARIVAGQTARWAAMRGGKKSATSTEVVAAGSKPSAFPSPVNA
jgi:hypothetical protein